MNQIKFPDGYEFIGKSSIDIINYHNPKGPKRKATLDVFMETKTGKEFVKPENTNLLIKLDTLRKITGKEPQPVYYDLSQALKFYPY